MKKTLLVIALTTVMTLGFTTSAKADIIYDSIPACTLYVNPYAPLVVPASFQCAPYYLNGQLIFNAISVNE